MKMYLRKVREAKLDKIGRKKEMGGFVKLSQHIYIDHFNEVG